jgi:hypothetical protein
VQKWKTFRLNISFQSSGSNYDIPASYLLVFVSSLSSTRPEMWRRNFHPGIRLYSRNYMAHYPVTFMSHFQGGGWGRGLPGTSADTWFILQASDERVGRMRNGRGNLRTLSALSTRCSTWPDSVALSPQANYTDWSTATCRRNLVQTFMDRGV